MAYREAIAAALTVLLETVVLKTVPLKTVVYETGSTLKTGSLGQVSTASSTTDSDMSSESTEETLELKPGLSLVAKTAERECMQDSFG